MLGCIPAVGAAIYNVYTNNTNRSFWTNATKLPMLMTKPNAALGYVQNYLAMIFGADHEYANN